MGHDWPGNVRELHNALERAVILCDGELITAEHLSLQVSSVAPRRLPRLSDVERHTIELVLSESEGNKSTAARRLGITRTQLYSRLRKYGLETAPSARSGCPSFVESIAPDEAWGLVHSARKTKQITVTYKGDA